MSDKLEEGTKESIRRDRFHVNVMVQTCTMQTRIAMINVRYIMCLLWVFLLVRYPPATEDYGHVRCKHGAVVVHGTQ